MYNLTIPLNSAIINEVVTALSELPFPKEPLINIELQELTVLCEVSHTADVERILAPYV